MNRFLIVVFLISLSVALQSQILHPDIPIIGEVEKIKLEFEHLTVNDGLANNEVNYIFQDSVGYLWFATINGLSRYDGVQIINYKNIPGDSTSISNNWITSITEDNYGNLWIGTKNGLNKFNRRKEEFERFKSEAGQLNSISNNYVRSLYADKQGVLWIETANAFLTKYEIKKDSFFHFRHQPYKEIIPLHYNSHHIYKAKDGNLWIGTRNIGAYNFDVKQLKYIRHFISYDDSEWGKNLKTLSNRNVTCFYEDENSNLWIGSSTSPLNIYNPKTEVFHRCYDLKDIYSICEVKKNQVWLGSSANGLFIYNFETNKLENVVNDPDRENSLIDNAINFILKDYSGNVWIATDKGVSKYNFKKDRIKRFKHEKGDNNSLSENNVTALLEDHEGNIWIGTQRSGLNKYDRETKEITRHNASNSGLSSDNISYLYQDSNNDLYIGLMEGIGFDRYQIDKNTFHRFVFHKNSTRKDWYRGFLEDSYGNFWVSLWGAKGFVKFDREKESFSAKSYFNIYQNLRRQQITKVIAIGDHVFTVYSGTGLYVYNTKENSYKAFQNKAQLFENLQRFDQLGMPNYGAKSFESNYGNIVDIGASVIEDLVQLDSTLIIVLKDKLIHFDAINLKVIQTFDFQADYVFPAKSKHHIWLQINNELKLYSLIKQRFVSSFKVFQNQNITKAKELKDGIIWMIIENKLHIFDTKNQTLRQINFSKEVQDFIAINDKNLLIGGSEGLYTYNIENEEIIQFDVLKNYRINCLINHKQSILIGTDVGFVQLNKESNEIKFHQEDNFLTNQIFSINFEHDSLIWLGTNKGFGAFDLNDGLKMVSNMPDKFNISSHLQTYLYEDQTKNIWLGTADRGVSIFNPVNEEFIHFLPEKDNDNSIHDSYVNFIFQDSEENIYIGNDIMNIFINKDSSFLRIYPENSWLPGKPISIQEDNLKNIWIGTENGIVKYNIQSKESRIFNRHDGFHGNQFSKASYKLKSGELMFGGIHGFSLFHPDSLKVSQYNPKIEITGFDIFDNPIYADFTQKDTIFLTYKDNFFTIYFTSFDYSAPVKNKFKYQLKGIDKEWVERTSETKANYTNVPPGNYLFTLKGTNSDGKWSNFEDQLYIRIKPAFWQTAWFKFLITIIVFLAGIYFLYQWIRRIRIMQKNIELEQRMLRSQMNPHFIFNSLTAIQYYIFGNEPAKAGKYLSGFAKLMRLILMNSRNEFVLLEKEIETLEHYLQLQQLRFENKFDFNIHVDEDLFPETTLVPPMLAQPYIENSIEHGIKNIDYKGQIEISFKINNNQIEVRIEDNGIGINEALQSKIPKLSDHKSLGASITKERLLNIAKFHKQSINLEVIDKKSIGKQTGTIIKYNIPLKMQS